MFVLHIYASHLGSLHWGHIFSPEVHCAKFYKSIVTHSWRWKWWVSRFAISSSTSLAPIDSVSLHSIVHPRLAELSQPYDPSDTRTFPIPSPLNKYVLWTPSQNILAHAHAYSQSAPLLDTFPEDSKGAAKVTGEGGDRLCTYWTFMVEVTCKEIKTWGRKRFTSCLFPCDMALMFGHGIVSPERLLRSRPCLKIWILGLFDGNCDSAEPVLWTYEQVMRGRTRERWQKDGKGVREEWDKWEERERGTRDRWVGEEAARGATAREGVMGWGWNVMGQRVTHLFSLMNPQTVFSDGIVFRARGHVACLLKLKHAVL